MQQWHEIINFSSPVKDVIIRYEQHDNCSISTLILISQTELSSREKIAYENGRADGEKAISDQLIRQRGELLELQNGILHSMAELLPEIRKQCEKSLIELAFESVKKIIGQIPISREIIESVITDALNQMEESTDFTILLNPEDLNLLQQVNSPLSLPTQPGSKIRFQSSNDISRGDCIIKSKFGTIDARREKKLEIIKNLFSSQ